MRISAPLSLILITAALAGCATEPSMLAARNAEAVSLEQCDHVTGSRIRAKPQNDCTPVGYPFKSISKESLDATGEIDLIDALRTLDPAFR